MRVLVTGGTGYLGAAIVRALTAHGHEPIVFARRASQAEPAAQAFDGDVCDGAAIRRAAERADAVCHTAALVSLWRRRPADFDDVNVGGLKNVLDACRALGTPRIIYTSSFLARPPAGAATPLAANDYQRTKAAALDVARAAAADGLPILSLLPGVIYGPGAETEGNLVGRLIRDHIAGRLPGLVGADRIWSFAYVDDVAEAHVAALTRGRVGGEYAIGGENVPQMRAFEIARGLRGGRLPRRVPVPIARIVARIEETRARIFDVPPLLTRGAIEIFERDWPLDSTRSEDELSYRRTPLESGIRATLSGL